MFNFNTIVQFCCIKIKQTQKQRLKLLLRLFGRKLYYVIFRVRNTVTLYSTGVYVLVIHKRQVESGGGQKIPDGTWGRNRRGSRGVTFLHKL